MSAPPKARKRFGQHFLEAAWADKVIEAIAPQPTDRFLEIGAGAGVLTTRLAARSRSVSAVELDRDLADRLRPDLPSNVELMTADILDIDLEPFLTAGPLRVAGNLPYNISSPILFKLLEAARRFPTLIDATVMLQREVADRLVAPVGTKAYGVLAIFATSQARVERLLTLPPGAFRPMPQVQSAVVRLTFKPSVIPVDDESFTPLVRTIFMQRRKTLLNALRAFAEARGRSSAAALSAADIDSHRRPETLTLAELARLSGVFRPTA